MYKRYGDFCFGDYISTWLVIVFLFALLVIGLLIDTPFYLLIWPLMVVVMGWSIFKPNREYFWISNDTITAMYGRNKQCISIPSELIIVVSYADICPSFAKRVSCGNQTYMLKGRYAISILQNISPETALARLHQNYTYKYTNSIVEEFFEKNCYVYSCVGSQELLEKLLLGRNHQVIIPETLLNQISVDSHLFNVYVDIGY